jgi:hypothetical protein
MKMHLVAIIAACGVLVAHPAFAADPMTDFAIHSVADIGSGVIRHAKDNQSAETAKEQPAADGTVAQADATPETKPEAPAKNMEQWAVGKAISVGIGHLLMKALF